MKSKHLLLISAVSLASFGTACSTATAPADSKANVNANANVAVVQNDQNPIANMPAPSPVANSAIPGIPNAPANANITKVDPTKNAKVQTMGNPAPDNSEVTVSLGQYPMQTRTFKSHPQLAKVEMIEDISSKKKSVKVYLRNGQVKELPENAIQNAMQAPAAEIAQAAQNAQAAKPEPKTENQPAGESQPRLQKQPIPQKQQ